MGTTVSGTTISSDQTWSGEILVTGPVYVPEGVTLRIEPGSRIEFAAIQSYRDDQIGMELDGRLLAEGTASQPIWFTSAAVTPRNGDWGMLRLNGATGSSIEYAIVEFAQQGINLWGSDVTIANSVVRWNNWEGIYLENQATAAIFDTLIYQNGYNGIAMEQFNDVTVTGSIIEDNGSHGIHIDASTALLEGNLVSGNGFSGISLDNDATLTARDNNITNNSDQGFAFGEGEFSLTLSGNDASGNPEGSGLSAAQQSANGIASGPGELKGVRELDRRPYELGYTPSDQQLDTYPYVFPDDDERSILLRHGEGLGLTWSLAVAGDTLWTATLSGDIYQLDAESGQILKTLKAPSVQPWGMTHDGQHLWITDFAEKRTYRLDTDSGQELFSFANPSQEAGAKGLAWDGSYLYIMGWEDQTIYKTTTQGELVATIKLEGDGGGGLTWDGSSFWVPAGKKLLQYSPSGQLLDEIYGGSEGNWDLSWDPTRELLWASQRTNENWLDDARIFGLRVYEQTDVNFDDQTWATESESLAIVIGTDGADQFDIVNELTNQQTHASVFVGDGDDTVTDSNGDDFIMFGSGSDTLNTSSGADLIYKAGGGSLTINASPDGVWGHGYYAQNVGLANSIGTENLISLAGLNRFHDTLALGDSQIDVTVNASLPTNATTGLAVFTEDVFSPRHADVNPIAQFFTDSDIEIPAGLRSFSSVTPESGASFTINGSEFGDLFDFTTELITAGSPIDGYQINYFGHGGDDVIWGSAFANIDGGAGDDIINGGYGDNTLTGGSGSDIFEFTATSGNDTITDFNKDEDKLHFYFREGEAEESAVASINNGVVTWDAVTVDLGDASLAMSDLNISYEMV